MKKIRLIYLFTFMSVSLIIINSCKKDDNTINPEPVITKPVLTTTSFTDIKQSTVTGGGNISSNGGADITARGICWSQVTSPSISDKIECNANGMSENSNNNNLVKIFPNPSKDGVNIKSDKIISKVEIFNSQGQLIKTVNSQNKEISVSIDGVLRGIYFAKVHTNNGDMWTGKIIKE